jgi:hypothetical protein
LIIFIWFLLVFWRCPRQAPHYGATPLANGVSDLLLVCLDLFRTLDCFVRSREQVRPCEPEPSRLHSMDNWVRADPVDAVVPGVDAKVVRDCCGTSATEALTYFGSESFSDFRRMLNLHLGFSF